MSKKSNPVETQNDTRVLYGVARIGESVFYSKYDEKSKTEILKAITENGWTMDFVLYACAEKPLQVYEEKIGDQVIPFALTLYGDILAKAQGVDRKKVAEFFTDLDKHLGISRPSSIITPASGILPA